MVFRLPQLTDKRISNPEKCRNNHYNEFHSQFHMEVSQMREKDNVVKYDNKNWTREWVRNEKNEMKWAAKKNFTFKRSNESSTQCAFMRENNNELIEKTL